MTRLLDEGIEAVRNLPDERQDEAGQLLLAIAGRHDRRLTLTAEQIDDLKIGLAEADRGEFASDHEMNETWKKFGL